MRVSMVAPSRQSSVGGHTRRHKPNRPPVRLSFSRSIEPGISISIEPPRLV
jgi:hypothetical protein